MEERNQKCYYKDDCKNECRKCIRFAGIQRLLRMSNIPEKCWNRECLDLYMSKDCKDRKAFEELALIQKNIVNFVNCGEQLYICSSLPGNGKTTWALKLLIAYPDEKSYWLAEKPRGMFVNVSDYLYKSKDFGNQLPVGFRDSMIDCELLVLDDIAITGLTDFDYLNLYGVIEMRELGRKATIFTGNCVDANAMELVLGERLTSRIWNGSTLVKFVEDDARGMKQ